MNVRSMLSELLRVLSYVAHVPIWSLRGSRVAGSSRVGARTFLMKSRIGKYVYLGEDVYLIHVNMGNYCSIAAGTKIGGMEHSWWWGSTSPKISNKCIYGKTTTIGEDVWMGFNVSVRQGVTIGRGAVVGSGAVVLKDVEPYTIVGGVPAREIRKRFSDDVIEEIEGTRYWEKSPDKAAQLLEAISYP